MAKYLDDNGLVYFWGKIKTWVTARIPAPSPSAPLMDGTASIGTESSYARSDHRHPSDTSKVTKNDDITGATKTKITYDSKGLVTGGTDLSESDIPGITLSKITDITATAAEVNYIKGVTSAVQTQLNNKADLVSPAFTGTPTAPTAPEGTNSTQIATTAFVATAVQVAASGVSTFQGTVSAGSTIASLVDYKKGWYWVVDTAGTYVGQVCEVGDFIFCIDDYDSSYKTSDFSVVQTNMTIETITNTEIETITAN